MSILTGSPTSRSHSIRFAFITLFLDAVGIGLILPVIPDLIQEVSGSNLRNAAIYGGYLTFIYALMQFLTGPTLGNLSDRFGRRPVLLVSLLTLGLDYIIMGLAPSLTLLAIGRFIAGIAGATHATAFAFAADISPPEERTRNFGLVGAGFGFGFIAGPVLGGLAAEWGTRMPFFLAAALVGLNILYGLFILPESLPREKRRPFSWQRSNPIGAFLQALSIPGLVLFLFSFFLLNLAGYIYPSIWPYYTREAFGWSSRDVGLSLGFFGLFYALTQMAVIPMLAKRLKDSTIAMIGIFIQTATMLALLFISKGWMLYLFLPFSALESIAPPAIQGLMSSRVPDNAQGELQGAVSSLMAITTILSPLIMTHAFAFFARQDTPYYHPAGAFGLAALITITALFPLRRAISTTNRVR